MDVEKHTVKKYEPVIPEIEDWPIARFYREKDKIIQEVSAQSISLIEQRLQRRSRSLQDLIAKTMYLERIRMSEEPWRVDPKDEAAFWASIKAQLVKVERNGGEDAIATAELEALLERIVRRYVTEISTHFKPASYHFAKRVLPFLFSSLLNAAAGGKAIKSMIYHDLHLQQKVHLLGETESIRRLAKKGTIILLPTHLSNMDSILVAWGLHALGLPAFIYGAGLNLFNNRVLGYFMKRLGAYKVDRRKKNPIYLETLYAYVNHATRQGVHGLFFPGGTRSRSGEIEDKLKLGLLGTAVESQRLNFLHPPEGHSGKIFVVPLVMSYHFVLEASSLINQHLTRTGQENYFILNDEFSNYGKFFKFVWTSFSRSSEIALSFGKPMDIFGHFVDEEGQSLDDRGRPVDIAAYFMSKGQVVEDKQRDREYTRMLGEKIAERYLVENRVFSSHLVAFVAFRQLLNQFQEFDLYGVLRLPEEERYLPGASFTEAVARVLGQLRSMADKGRVHLAEHLNQPLEDLILHGVKNLGIYHAKRPLTRTKNGQLHSENMNLLYYYHNRLSGYGLESFV